MQLTWFNTKKHIKMICNNYPWYKLINSDLITSNKKELNLILLTVNYNTKQIILTKREWEKIKQHIIKI
jgi:hypothetical protein